MPFQDAGQALINPLLNLWNNLYNILPGIILAIIILVIGYIIAFILGHATKVILQKLGLDRQLAKAQLTKTLGHIHVSSALGEAVKWLIFVIFLGQAAEQLRLGALTDVILRFVNWLPGLIVAALVVLFGLFVAHYVALKIEEHTKVKGAKFASTVLKAVITFIVIMIALEQIGVDVSILKFSFLILLAGIALAVGLSFGLGSRKEANELVRNIRKYF